jgi:HEPN domain-containing protein
VSKQSDPHEWLRFAHDDLPAARLLLTDPELPARMACFHAQQAAEKALKASLVHAAIQFRKTHDLVVLVALQPEPVRSEVSNLDLQRLQQWAVDALYPADLPDITAGDAAAVVAMADQIVAAVALAVGADGLA